MSQVITCPHCDKKLALRDELKGRALICPQCKNRFTAPADPPQATAEVFDTAAEEPSSPNGSDMGFLDSLAPTAGPVAAKTATKSPVAAKSTVAVRSAAAARATVAKTAASPASRAAASRAKQKNNQMLLLYIGGGIAAAVLVVILIAVGISSSGGRSGGKQNGKILFGLTDSTRHKLFKEMILAVDGFGISKECKEEWYRLADQYKLDRAYLKDILNEGFDRKDWDQPAPAHVTNVNRGTRMEWNAKRAHGPDPILAM